MTQNAEAADPETKDQKEDTAPSGSVRRSPPVLGLVIVSALNIATLGFITYHFASHADESAVERSMPPKGGDGSNTEGHSPAPGVMMTTANMRGNVDLVPAPATILEIASGIEQASLDERAAPTDMGGRREMAALGNAQKGSVDKADVTEETPSDGDPEAEMDREDMKPESANWVQLGALSNQAVAERFWAELQTKHAGLLEDREPLYVGPDDVGGNLHHIRVGPMTTDDASALCKKLEARGTDCFCLKAKT